MAIPMNVVALAGIPGISFIPVTHGLGAYTTTPPMPPATLLQGGGGDNEEWWQQRGVESRDQYNSALGYVRRGYGFADSDIAWELGDDPYGIGKPVSLAQFTERMVTGLHAEAKQGLFANIALELAKQDRQSEAERQKIVKVTITAAGLTYVALKILPLL